LLWNKSGSALLAYVSTDVDTSGKSYYGKDQLYFMNPKQNINAMISISEKSGLQDAQWHPNGQEFVVIDDHPTRIMRYNHKGVQIQEIARDCPRNAIRFDSNGQLMWLGGFGNLNGEMSFMHWKGPKSVEMLGYNKDQTCRYFEYSPDGSMFITGRLHEFIKIDNGFRIYSYNGYSVMECKYDKLHQVAFRPVPTDTYGEITNIQKGPTQPTESDKKSYVPPHLRGKDNAPKEIDIKSRKPNNRDHENTTLANPKPKKQQQPKETDEIPWPRGARFQECMERSLDETEGKSKKRKRKKKNTETKMETKDENPKEEVMKKEKEKETDKDM